MLQIPLNQGKYVLWVMSDPELVLSMTSVHTDYKSMLIALAEENGIFSAASNY